MLAELQSLAALASSRPNIMVEEGESGCAWSFNWATGVITVNPADLVLRPPDFCRGLILHEAAHGAITRIADIVPRKLRQREPGIHHLLNVVEDCRIENWLQQRFPGCRPWVRLYNDRLLVAPASADGRARLARDPAGGFLLGLLSEWWREQPPCELHPLATDAIAAVKPRFLDAVAAFPAPKPPSAAMVLPVYQSHRVAGSYRALDHERPPTTEECVIRMTQHRMWEIVWEHIVPVFRKLLDHPDSQPTRQRTADEMASAAAMAGHLCDADHRGRHPEAADHDSTPPANRSERTYHQALAKHGALIESCAELLLRLLTLDSRPKTSRCHRSGNRLDLRVAMQCEADPRQYERVFQRRTLASRPDPAFILLADESGSMRGPRARATFDAVVVMREVCLRLGIPLGIVGFSSACRIIQHWEDPDASMQRRSVAALLQAGGSSTRLDRALDTAIGMHDILPASCRPRLWILSDGEVSNVNEIRNRITAIRMGGTPVHCLGLGPDADGLRNIIPSARTGIQPVDLPEVFSQMLESQIHA